MIIPSRKVVTIEQVMWQYPIDIPFKAVVTFANSVTGEFIEEKTIEGIWKGTLVSKIQTTIKEKDF